MPYINSFTHSLDNWAKNSHTSVLARQLQIFKYCQFNAFFTPFLFVCFQLLICYFEIGSHVIHAKFTQSTYLMTALDM